MIRPLDDGVATRPAYTLLWVNFSGAVFAMCRLAGAASGTPG